MGLIHAKITLVNTVDASNAFTGIINKDKVRKMDLTALVDKGSTMLCINENIALELWLTTTRESMMTLADGSKRPARLPALLPLIF